MTMTPSNSSTLTDRQYRKLQAVLLGKYMVFLVSVRDLSQRQRAERYTRWCREPEIVEIAHRLTAYDRAHEIHLSAKDRMALDQEFAAAMRWYDRKHGQRRDWTTVV